MIKASRGLKKIALSYLDHIQILLVKSNEDFLGNIQYKANIKAI